MGAEKKTSVDYENMREAVDAGDLATLRRLRQAGGDVNVSDSRSPPLLTAAAHSGNDDIVAWLLKQGATVNAGKNDGFNALNEAASKGHAGIVSMFLQAGADVNSISNREGTPLHQAVANNHLSRHRDLLLNAGAETAPEAATVQP